MSDLPQFIRAIYFAAQKHRMGRRKGNDLAPYINHPLEVVNLLTDIGKVENFEILTAAVLHDTLESTDTTKEEIARYFGYNVCKIVLEITDDQALSKTARKKLQIVHAPNLSPGAKLVKLADKISNIREIIENPPSGWTVERKIEYVEWGKKVVAGLRGSNKNLEDYFDDLVERSEQAFGRS